MREIKFRAWDKVTRKVLEVIEIDFQGMEILVIDHEEQEAREAVFGHYELMQYTGLKDKNGVEIYEGDIIRGPHDFGPGGFSVIAAPVKYHVIHGYQLHYFLLEQTEVIGNIYQHPELLGDSQ